MLARAPAVVPSPYLAMSPLYLATSRYIALQARAPVVVTSCIGAGRLKEILRPQVRVRVGLGLGLGLALALTLTLTPTLPRTAARRAAARSTRLLLRQQRPAGVGGAVGVVGAAGAAGVEGVEGVEGVVAAAAVAACGLRGGARGAAEGGVGTAGEGAQSAPRRRSVSSPC